MARRAAARLADILPSKRLEADSGWKLMRISPIKTPGTDARYRKKTLTASKR
jgi:hypothetical protein